MNKLENFWNSCDTNFAHLELKRHLSGFDNLVKSWENSFIKEIKFDDLAIIDYGIGGGHLGKYLLKNKKIKFYYGVDISERSLSFANKNLSKYSNKIDLLHTNLFYSNEFLPETDVFISLACIQHFPDEKYLIKFLNKINTLNPKIVVLQIRFSENTEFSEKNSYLNEDDVCFACKTNSEYLLKYLNKYSLTYSTSINSTSKYQYLIFKKN